MHAKKRKTFYKIRKNIELENRNIQCEIFQILSSTTRKEIWLDNKSKINIWYNNEW